MKFEGTINGVKYDSQEEFNKELAKIQQSGNTYTANYHWQDSNMDSQDPVNKKKVILNTPGLLTVDEFCPDPKYTLDTFFKAYDYKDTLEEIKKYHSDLCDKIHDRKKDIFQESILNGNFYNLLSEYQDLKNTSEAYKKDVKEKLNNNKKEIDAILKTLDKKYKESDELDKEYTKHNCMNDAFKDAIDYMRAIEEMAINNGSWVKPKTKPEPKPVETPKAEASSIPTPEEFQKQILDIFKDLFL